MKWEETFFVVKWMFENINTTQLDSSDDYQMVKIADDAHLAFLKAQYPRSESVGGSMRAKDKGDIFDLLRFVGDTQAHGLDIKALGISREVLTGLVKAAVERDRGQLKQIRQTLARRPEPADPIKGLNDHRKTRPDADTDP